jgi:PAS domain S-box-containing protein
MNNASQSQKLSPRKFISSKIAVIYALAGGLYILLSDLLLAYLVTDSTTLTRLQTIKGWFFITVTSVLLYWFIRWYLKQARRAQEQILSLSKFPEENPNPILRIAPDGTLLHVNKAGETLSDLWGAQRGQPLPESLQQLICKVLDSHDTQEMEIECQGKIFSLLFTPIADADYVNIYGRDVTKQKQTEEALRHSEERFRAVAQSANDAIISADSRGIIISWNKGAKNIFGYEEAEVLGRPVTQLMPERYQKSHQEGMERLRSLGEARIIGKTVELDGLRKDGGEFPLELSLAAWKVGEEIFYTGILRDITERRRAEEIMRDSEERYRLLFESNPSPLWVYDLETLAFLAVNDAAVRLYGYSYAEFREMTIKDIRPPEEIPALLERMPQHKGGIFVEGVRKHRKKDGTVIFVEVASTGIMFGTKLARLVLAKDITDRLRAEEKLRESETRYRALAESTNMGIWQISPAGYTIYINPAMKSMLEMEPDEELIGKTYHSFFTPESLITMEHEHAKRLQGLSSFYEVEIVGKSGRRRQVIICGAPLMGADGSLHSRIGSFIDITELKQAEAARKESEERYHLLFRESPVGIFHYNTQLRLTEVNDRFISILQSSRERLIGFDMNTLKDQSVLPAIKKTLEGEEGYYEGFYRATNGPAEIWVSMRTAPLLDHKGEIIGGVGIVEDITERKHLEEQLQQSQKMEAVGTLAGGVAHDFNNILTVLLSNLELAKFKIEQNQSVKPYLLEMENIADRAAQLTRQLLAFSRRQIIKPVPVNLNDTVTNMRTMLSRLIGEHIELELRLEGKLGMVKADPGQMEQVIMNLCVNARDAMPRGGKLTLATQKASLDEIYIKDRPWVKSGEYVLLEVTDTGQGMDEATRARIFEPFFTTKEIGKGTGLGLSMVYGIVKQHQGYINVYSEPEQGTVFKIYLPLWKEKTAPAEAVVPEAPEREGGKETILVAEDEEQLREALQRILESYGYTVLVARDGQEACSLYEQEKEHIDLVILDAVMPKMGGKEAAECVYKINPRQKILFSSGYSAEGLHEGFTIPEGMHFIQKPFRAKDLVQKIKEVLET